jgi:secreted Zn-dependent insulinase-like peptidase
MTLTVQSQHELDTLEKWVVDTFSAVPDNEKEREVFSHMTDPFKTEGFSHIYKLAPIRDTYQGGQRNSPCLIFFAG